MITVLLLHNSMLMKHDLILLLLIGSLLGGLIIGAKVLSKANLIDSFLLRKILHMAASAVACFIIVYICNIWLALILPIGSLLLNGMQALGKTDYMGESPTKRNFGAFFFSIIIILGIICSRINYTWYSTCLHALLLLGFCDPIAALVGHYINKNNFRLQNQKSLWGACAFFICAVLIQICGCLLFLLPIRITFILAVAFILASIELASLYSFDNLLVPICYVLSSFFLQNLPIVDSILICVHGLLTIFCLFRNKLTEFGALSAYTVALLYIFWLDWYAYVDMILFALAGIFVPRFFRHKNNEECRTTSQVLCNTLPATIFCLGFHFTKVLPFIIALSACFASNCADTIASTVGITSQRLPKNILTLQYMTPGLSGGVTPKGTLAGILAAAFMTIPFLVMCCIEKTPPAISILYIAIIIASGICGMLLDSVLGVFQMKYKCGMCNSITEEEYCCNKKATYFTGIRILTNNTVNLISSASACLLAFACSWLIFIFAQ